MVKNALNPFKPGAGHSPPHLAGRENEAEQFSKLLDQLDITQNVILTGLRGVGKTVLTIPATIRASRAMLRRDTAIPAGFGTGEHFAPVPQRPVCYH